MVIQEAAGHTKKALSYSIRHFDGPLDFLLHLVEKAQINIYDIPISEITDQFLHYLEVASKLDLDDLTEFYAMAAHLIYMKSRLLIPSDDTDDEDFEFNELRSELVEKLLDYQKFKRYTALLADTNHRGELFIQRKKNQFMLPFEDQELWSGVSVWNLLETFSTLLKSMSHDHVYDMYEEVTPRQKLTYMAELFEKHEEISFLDIVGDPHSPLHIICAFLAILDAVKWSMITIFQHQLFGDIVIRKKDDFDVESIVSTEYDASYDMFLEQEQEKVTEPTPLLEEDDQQNNHYDIEIELEEN